MRQEIKSNKIAVLSIFLVAYQDMTANRLELCFRDIEIAANFVPDTYDTVLSCRVSTPSNKDKTADSLSPLARAQIAARVALESS